MRRVQMTTQILLDLIRESVMVDFEEGLISSCKQEENCLLVSATDGSEFVVSVNKIPPKIVINYN